MADWIWSACCFWSVQTGWCDCTKRDRKKELKSLPEILTQVLAEILAANSHRTTVSRLECGGMWKSENYFPVHSALTFCNEFISRSPFLTQINNHNKNMWKNIVSSPRCMYVWGALSVRMNFERPVRGRKEREPGKDEEKKLRCWPCRFFFSGTPASHIHQALMLMAVTELQPPHHAQITPLPQLQPHAHTHTHDATPPLSLHDKGDLTQKWVETNDSNESRCPPANVCRHYCCPCKWLQMALFLVWQTAAPLHWTSNSRGKFLPELSYEARVLLEVFR